MYKKVVEKILQAIEEINDQLPQKQKLAQSTSTVLFGKDGKLDSLGLVNLLVIIEQNIEDEFDISITIADERAMSQKHSPFRTIGTLAKYINMLFKKWMILRDFILLGINYERKRNFFFFHIKTLTAGRSGENSPFL